MEFHEILGAIMHEKDMSIADVARACGLTDSTVRSIFDRKQKKIALSVAFKLSEGLGVSLQRLNGMPDVQNKNTTSLSDEALKVAKDYSALDASGKRAVRVTLDDQAKRVAEETQHNNIMELYPVRSYLQPASAGYGDFCDDNSFEEVDLVKRPPAGTSFLVTVNGDSMEPDYQDGDSLFIHAQETLRHGEVGLFAINGDLFIKEYTPDGLLSYNPKYGLRMPEPDDTVRIFGRVLGICTKDYFG